MFLLWTFGIFFLYTVKGAEVCYDRLGCFSDTKPWGGTLERPIARLPESPEKINTRLLLLTPDNQNSFQLINATNSSSIYSSNFRTNRKTRFVIHGYLGSGEDPWLSNICRELFKIEDSNCICVDWSGGSRTLYSQSSNNIRVVAAEVAFFLTVLQSLFGYSPYNVHLIGHSLGAHCAGYVGAQIKNISRITGMDAARPYFEGTPTVVRLDLSDAILVDAIHTDAGLLGLGMRPPFGHLDFFPNGGAWMPGCPLSFKFLNLGLDLWAVVNGIFSIVACNHFMSITYYTNSIASSDAYVSYPCRDWSTYQAGRCTVCPSAGCPRMGHHAENYLGVSSSNQVFYLRT